MQRHDELQRTLARLGVPSNLGPVEQSCNWLQRQLTPDEKLRWIAAANATPNASDDAIHALEAEMTTTLAGRRSVSVEQRDPWFGPRLTHITTFLKD